MENTKLILTFDVGTQSTRGMLVNEKGDIEAIIQKVYPEAYYSKNKDWAEQRADFYYEVIVEITKELISRYKEKFERVIAVTSTVFRDSVICLDENRKPIRDMILWLDKREIDSDELPLPKLKETIFKLVGVIDMVDMQHRQSVCNYIMSREKEVWSKTDKYVVLSTYLNYKLSGNLIDSKANMIAHMPFDYKHGKWSGKSDLTRCVYDIPLEKLCDLCEPGDVIGYLSEEFVSDTGLNPELVVIATGSDKGCETLGLSVASTNKAAVSFGTSATIQFATPKYFEPQPFCPAYPSPQRGIFNPEYQVYRGYWMLTWFKNNFVSEEERKAAKEKGISIEEYFNSYLHTVPAGCDGLMLQPHWAAGVANPNAKGAIIGWSDVQSKYHIYRAIIEGVNYELMYGLETMAKRGGQTIREVYVGGGGSKSSEICQITADMLGLPVKRIQTHEACGLGASIIGFVTMDVYKDELEAINAMVRVKDVFTPDMAKHEFYMANYKNVYCKMAKRLVPLYKSSKSIRKGLH